MRHMAYLITKTSNLNFYAIICTNTSWCLVCVCMCFILVFAHKNDQLVFSHANITIHCNFFKFRRKIILHFLKWFSFTAQFSAVYNTSIRYCFCCLICWNFQSFHPVMCPFMWVQNLANSLDISTFLVSANQH